MQDSWAGQVRGLGRPVFGWASFVLQWATIVFKWVAFSCHVRAGTACRDRGPDTAHHRVVPALTLRPSCRARVRVVFLVSCVVPPVVSGPSGHLYWWGRGVASHSEWTHCARPVQRWRRPDKNIPRGFPGPAAGGLWSARCGRGAWAHGRLRRPARAPPPVRHGEDADPG
jgi:hypothetical protein